jgi:hypothetical protein
MHNKSPFRSYSPLFFSSMILRVAVNLRCIMLFNFSSAT